MISRLVGSAIWNIEALLSEIPAECEPTRHGSHRFQFQVDIYVRHLLEVPQISCQSAFCSFVMLLESRLLSLRWVGEVKYMAPKSMWKSDVPERGVNGRPGADSSSSHVRSTQVYAQVAEPSC